MSIKLNVILGGTAAGCLTLASCGTGDNTDVSSTSTPLPVVTKQLDTAAVLTIAQSTSESSSPFKVDGGAVAVVPADDETGTPIPVTL